MGVIAHLCVTSWAEPALVLPQLVQVGRWVHTQLMVRPVAAAIAEHDVVVLHSAKEALTS